jgi:transposase-like protein
MRCPHCGDPMIAPEMSEFVVGGEIRHHWQCDNCGRSSSTAFSTASKKPRARRNR